MKIENVAVISLEDYAEYQELKKMKKVDFLKLGVGSVVKFNLDKSKNLTAGTCSLYHENKKYTLVIINSDIQVNNDGIYRATSKNYTTAVDEHGWFIHIVNFNAYMISEVISY